MSLAAGVGARRGGARLNAYFRWTIIRAAATLRAWCSFDPRPGGARRLAREPRTRLVPCAAGRPATRTSAHPGMFADLRALIRLAERHRSGFRLRLFVLAGGWVVAEWLVLFNVVQGLARQRHGEAPTAQLLMFLLAVGCYYWGQRWTYLFTGGRFIALTRAKIRDILLRLHRLRLLDFEALERGKLMTGLLGDGNRLAASGRPLVNAVSSAQRLLVAVLFVMIETPAAAGITFVASVLVVEVGLGQLRVMSAGFVRIARAEAELFELLRDQLRGALPIRLHRSRAQAMARAHEAIAGPLRMLRVDLWTRYFSYQSATNALVYGLLGANAFIVPLVAPVDGEVAREANLALLWLLFSVVQLVFAAPQLAEAARAAERLQELRERLADARLEPVAPPVGRGRFDDFRVLEVDALRFTYRAAAGAGFSIGPISLRLARGQLVFVTGRNGSGKSTFLKALTGLYVTGGHLRVDGAAIGPDELADYRALFGTIFVDHTLFERVYGMAPEDEPRAATLLAELGIADKTAIRDGRVTRRDLSTGQKKRLAMALTRLRDRPIVVFDEWAADQDPGFRDYYYHHLLPALRDAGKLVVVVTHDDRHFDRADRRIHFEDGRAREIEVAA